jgi:DNA-binding LytR/AlgR family response regulator
MDPTIVNSMPILDIIISKGKQFVNPIEIVYIEANNKHTVIYLSSAKCLYAHHLLKWFDEKLPETLFCRCHNSYIVNCLYIDCTCGNQIIMSKDNINIPVSREKKQLLKEKLAHYKQQQVFQSLQNNANHSVFLPVAPK